MATYYTAPTDNYVSTTLDGAINDSATTISVADASKLQAPGVVVINREDGNGNATPSAREVVSYTGISSNDLTGVTRGFDNSTARSHGDGSLVEAVFTVGMWNDLRDGVAAALSTDGTNLAITGTASIATLDADAAFVGTVTIETMINASGASILGFIGDPLDVATGAFTSIASIARMESGAAVLAGSSSAAQVFYKAGKGTITTDSDGATVTFDMDASNIHQVELAGNRTLAVSNADAGQAFVIRLIQDGTGSRTVTWFSTIKWPGGTEPTLTTTAAKTDVFGFITTSSGNYDGYILGTNL